MATDGSSARRPVGRPRDTSTHDRALAAALTVFARHGLHGSTIDRVAAEARVGKASIYLRWPDVSTLLADALATVLTRWAKTTELPQADRVRQLAQDLGTDLGRGMLALTLTAGLPLPLQSTVRLIVTTLEQLLIHRPDEDSSLGPEQQLGLLIARQLLRERDPQL